VSSYGLWARNLAGARYVYTDDVEERVYVWFGDDYVKVLDYYGTDTERDVDFPQGKDLGRQNPPMDELVFEITKAIREGR
jgi:hypothetical protein